jgi:thiamine-phosphate pyrophosphorylase/hydroxymethylpyrimidine kinase/phosphomethylpyrimidine kinase/thiamine-phosphate diphosphorylase
MQAQATSASFAPLVGPLGFYPVVPDAIWVERLLHWGVRTVQLRFKPAFADDDAVREQILASVAAGSAVPGAQVFINDHWQHAVALGAYGVHLGQEDWAALTKAERDALRTSGIRLGLSTHTPQELALAKSACPSYLAIGPVFHTTLKAMAYEPVGLERLREWVHLAAPYPVVAIGGITLERMADVRNCGVCSVAVVSAVTQAADPRLAAMQGLQMFEK